MFGRRALRERLNNARGDAARAVHNARDAAAYARRVGGRLFYNAARRRLGYAAATVASVPAGRIVGGVLRRAFGGASHSGGGGQRARYVRKLGHGTAWKKVRKVKALNGRPKVNRKFKAKVDRCLDFDKPWGQYTYISDARLYQYIRDEWNECSTDNNGKLFEQFTPSQIWDAAGVLFNAKTLSNDWEFNQAVGAGNNPRYAQPIHVINSHTTFEFKSTSSHVITVEMYICSPKGNSVTATANDLVNSSENSINHMYYYLNSAAAVTAGTFDLMKNEGATSAMWTDLHKQYNVLKVTIKLNPGEHKKHFLQGPKNRTVDGTKYLNDAGTYLSTSRFQKTVFFRTINDPTVSDVNTGTTATNTIGRWPSNYRGGVAMRQKRVIRVRMPETTEGSSIALMSEQKQNTFKIGHWVRIDTKDADQQVCVDNPTVLANTAVPQ